MFAIDLVIVFAMTFVQGRIGLRHMKTAHRQKTLARLESVRQSFVEERDRAHKSDNRAKILQRANQELQMEPHASGATAKDKDKAPLGKLRRYQSSDQHDDHDHDMLHDKSVSEMPSSIMMGHSHAAAQHSQQRGGGSAGLGKRLARDGHKSKYLSAPASYLRRPSGDGTSSVGVVVSSAGGVSGVSGAVDKLPTIEQELDDPLSRTRDRVRSRSRHESRNDSSSHNSEAGGNSNGNGNGNGKREKSKALSRRASSGPAGQSEPDSGVVAVSLPIPGAESNRQLTPEKAGEEAARRKAARRSPIGPHGLARSYSTPAQKQLFPAMDSAAAARNSRDSTPPQPKQAQASSGVSAISAFERTRERNQSLSEIQLAN